VHRRGRTEAHPIGLRRRPGRAGAVASDLHRTLPCNSALVTALRIDAEASLIGVDVCVSVTAWPLLEARSGEGGEIVCIRFFYHRRPRAPPRVSQKRGCRQHKTAQGTQRRGIYHPRMFWKDVSTRPMLLVLKSR
jgi:hypothetical protein